MDNYEKIRVIGRGAYGTVYLCNRKSDKQRLIIKEIPVDQMTKDERTTSLNEAKVLSMLDHPNIVAYHENFLSESTIAIVMEYAEGGTLYKYLEERNGSLLSEAEVMHIFTQLVLALQFVHSRSILHRDLKSQNILLNKDKTIVKIGDFGISKILSSKSKAVTVIGTPHYISPELCEGKPYNQKSDIWALGCVLYELLTLRRPFDADNLPALVMKIMQANFDPLPDIYDKNIKHLVNSMLHLDPDKRPSAPQIMALPFMVGKFYKLYMDFGCLPLGSRSHFSAENSNEQSIEKSISSALINVSEEHPCNVWLVKSNSENLAQLPLPSVNSVLKSISISKDQSIGVTNNGNIVIWKEGRNPSASRIPFVIDEKNAFDIATVSCGEEFSLCLSEAGVVSSWGTASSGCLGYETTRDVLQPKIIEALFGFNIVSISCGNKHAMVVTEDHEVYSWGHGIKGCLGLAKMVQEVSIPRPLDSHAKLKITKVFCGPDCSFAITESKCLLACGSNRCNKIAMDTEDGLQSSQMNVFTPVRSEPLPSLRIDFVSVSFNHTAIITDKGQLYTVGSNKNGQLGWGETGLTHNMPGLVGALSFYRVTQVSCGDFYTLAVTSEGHLYAWGICPAMLRDPDYLPVKNESRSLSFLSDQRVKFVSCSGNNCVLVTTSKDQ